MEIAKGFCMIRMFVLPNLSSYLIDSQGNVWSVKTGKFMKPQKTKDYLRIRLVGDDGSRKCYSVHLLVMEAFNPKPKEGLEVNHKDGNKENNSIDNLEWVTHSGNMKHAYVSGLQIPVNGESHGKSKLTEALVISIRTEYQTGSYTQKDLAQRFGVNKSTISRVISNKIWTHV